MEKYNYAPFYVGQKVVGNPKYQHMVRNGKVYIITSCRYEINPANGTGPYWYVGIDSNQNNAWLAPYLFLPIDEMEAISFSDVIKEEKVSVN